MKPRWGFDSFEQKAALAGAVTIGTAWVATGTGTHPVLLFVPGALVGAIFGFRCAGMYRDSGRVGRFFMLVLAGILIPLMTLLLAIRRVTEWW